MLWKLISCIENSSNEMIICILQNAHMSATVNFIQMQYWNLGVILFFSFVNLFMFVVELNRHICDTFIFFLSYFSLSLWNRVGNLSFSYTEWKHHMWIFSCINGNLMKINSISTSLGLNLIWFISSQEWLDLTRLEIFEKSLGLDLSHTFPELPISSIYHTV